MPIASKAALLSAQKVPSDGGETEWADMRAAYDALDTLTKAKIENLSAYHSLFYSQAEMGYEHQIGDGYGYHDKGSPLRTLVKTHPETGRKALYTGRHAHAIPGMHAEDSKNLLEKLLQSACQAPRVYRHKWHAGDIAMWDNRCLLHRARPYDMTKARVMRATRIIGDPATEQAATFVDNFAPEISPITSNT